MAALGNLDRTQVEDQLREMGILPAKPACEYERSSLLPELYGYCRHGGGKIVSTDYCKKCKNTPGSKYRPLETGE